MELNQLENDMNKLKKELANLQEIFLRWQDKVIKYKMTELAKKKATLSDKKHDHSQCAKTWDYAEEDVKEALKELIECINDEKSFLSKTPQRILDELKHSPASFVFSGSMCRLNNKAKEIFGERLLE